MNKRQTINLLSSRCFLVFVLLLIWTTDDSSVADAFAVPRRKQSTTATKQGFGVVSKPKKKKKKNSSPSYTADTSSTTKEFLEFLIEQEECEGIDCTELGVSSSATALRGIYAKESFPTDAYICAIPFVSTVLLDETFVVEDEEDLPEENKNDAENGLKFLQFLQKENTTTTTDKNWTPYLNCLPQLHEENFDPTPDFWSEEEIQQLEIPSILRRTLARKRNLEELHDQQQNKNISCSALQHAAWLVRTRAFTTYKKNVMNVVDGTKGLLRRTVLIPYLDMLNHATTTTANVQLTAVETKEYDECFYAITALKPITKGEELRLCYGTGLDTTLELFQNYGFIDENNKNHPSVTEEEDDDVLFTTSLEEDRRRLLEEEQDLTRTERTILSYLRLVWKKIDDDFWKKNRI